MVLLCYVEKHIHKKSRIKLEYKTRIQLTLFFYPVLYICDLYLKEQSAVNFLF